MSDPRVGRLRLVASHEDDVRRGAIVMADALRIASLPAARSARHYIVRLLDVGRFDRDAASQTVALAIERRVAQVEAEAVRFDAPGADAAMAVWFDDEVTALAELAVRVIAGPPPTEWFWRALAGGAVAREPAAAIAACTRAAGRHPAGVRALALVIDRVEHARPGAALGAWTAGEAERWLGPAPSGQAPAAVRASDASAIVARLAPAWRERLAAWVPRWGGDARAVRLVALALAASGAAPTEHAPLVALARAVVTAITAAARLDDAAPPPAIVPRAIDRAEPAAAPAQATDVHAGESVVARVVPADAEPPTTAPAPVTDVDAPAIAGVDVSAADARPRRADPPPVIGDAVTSVGGLLFLLRPLALLGLPAWIDGRSWAATSAFAARLLIGVARAHHAPDDDPLIAALALDAATLDPELDRPRWRGGWVRRLARWVHAHTDLSLGAIVARPAVVAATPTHVDVAFALRAADIRVRLAGLDVDPGWVPWLGRVVRFHYVDGASP